MAEVTQPFLDAVQVLPNLTVVSAASAVAEIVRINGQTVTLSGGTNITTATGFNYAEVTQPTYTSASPIAITNSSSFHIMGPPIAAGSVTLSNFYALAIDGTWTNTTGSGRGIRTAFTFAPTSGTGLFRAMSISYTINQTGGASGNVDGLFMNATETAFGGTTHGLFTIQVGGQNKLILVSNGTQSANLCLGPATGSLAATVLRVDPSKTVATATSATWDGVDVIASTLTLTGATAVTTATGINAVTLRAPTITDASVVTVTAAATLAISGAPVAAGSVTLTNKYALWVQGGDSRFDGIIRGLGTGGTRVFSQTNLTTDHGYLVLDDASGMNIGFTANAGMSTDGATLTIKSISGASIIQTTADTTKFLNAAATEAARFTVNLNLLLGTTTDVATTKLRINASKTVASATSAVWDGVDHIASTLTISGVAAITTATGVNANVFRQPTLSAASALTVTNAATVSIENAPVGAGAGPATLTNAYALWVQGGSVRLDSTLSIGGGGTATSTLDVFAASSGGTVQSSTRNTSNTASAKALDLVQVAGATADDAFTTWAVSGVTTWSAGIDNSRTGDPWVLAASATLGTTNVLAAATTGEISIGGGFQDPVATYLVLAATPAAAGSGATHSIAIENLSNSANSSARVLISVAGASAADPYFQLTTAVSDWLIGIDNSVTSPAPDPLVISRSNTTLGTNDLVRMTGAVTLASATSLIWDAIELASSTLTLTGSTAITTATGVNYLTVRAPTLTDGSAVTVTSAATLAIAGAPIAAGAGPVTITNAYALWVQAGLSRFDGDVLFALNSRASAQFDKTTDAALAAIPGLSATVVAGASYAFRIVLHVTAGATGGSRYDLNGGTASATALIANFVLLDDTTSANTITSRQTTLAGVVTQAGTTTGMLTVEGLITVNAAGTFAPRFAQSVSNGTTSSVLVGSTMLLKRIS